MSQSLSQNIIQEASSCYNSLLDSQKENFKFSDDSIAYLDAKIDAHFSILGDEMKEFWLQKFDITEAELYTETPRETKYANSSAESYKWFAQEASRIAKANVVYHSKSVVSGAGEIFKEYVHFKIEKFNNEVDANFDSFKIDNLGESYSSHLPEII